MKINRIIGFACALLAVAFTTSASAGDGSELEAFKKAIRVQYDMKEKAFADADANAIVDGFYTRDVISAGEGDPLMVGREAIRPLYEEVTKTGNVRIESFATRVSGNMGWDWANFYIMPKDPEVKPFSFIILFLWEKVDGQWMSAGDMFIRGEYVENAQAAEK